VQAYVFPALCALAVAFLLFAASTNNRMARMEALIAKEVKPFWKRVQTAIGRDLHHPHPRYRESDALIEQLESDTISSVGRARLEELLGALIVDIGDDVIEAQRSSARIMLLVMKKVVIEAETPPGTGDVR
jgi:hypothetical protein